jgi:cytochrome c biogenesis factor
MNFSTLPTVETAPNQGMMSLAFVIGMIALGFFVLIMLICLLHCMVTRRFSFFSIFHNSESSTRTNHTRHNEFGARIANLT